MPKRKRTKGQTMIYKALHRKLYIKIDQHEPHLKPGVNSGAGTAYPSKAPEFTPVFSGVHDTRSLVLCVMLYRSLFVLLSFFFWPLRCVLLRFTNSDYLFGIFKLFFENVDYT